MLSLDNSDKIGVGIPLKLMGRMTKCAQNTLRDFYRPILKLVILPTCAAALALACCALSRARISARAICAATSPQESLTDNYYLNLACCVLPHSQIAARSLCATMSLPEALPANNSLTLEFYAL